MKFNQSLCLGGVFFLTFLIMNYLLRPYTNAWSLILLPILFPLPFLTLPSLYNLRSAATFTCLLGGLGCGILSLLLVLN